MNKFICFTDKLFSIALGFVFVFHLPSVAQEYSSGEKVFASPPFSLVDDSVKPNTKGLDVEKTIYDIIKIKPPVKSEYETNAEFENRLDKFSRDKVFTNIGSGKKVAVIRSVSEIPLLWRGGNATVEVGYSAETEMMSVALRQPLTCWPLKRVVVPKRQYTATNGFGQKVSVVEADESETCLDLSKEGVVKDIGEVVFNFVVKKNSAASVKNALALAVIGRLVPPFAAEERTHERATIKYPVEINKKSRSLVMMVDDVWLMHSTSGQVLAKYKGNFANADPVLAEELTGFDNKCQYPDYRASELANRSMVVELGFSVDSSGRVKDGAVIVPTGNNDLDARALRSIGKCKFKPATRDGVPTDGIAVVKFHFSDLYAKNF